MRNAGRYPQAKEPQMTALPLVLYCNGRENARHPDTQETHLRALFERSIRRFPADTWLLVRETAAGERVLVSHAP
jgi:hypothetical protein